MGALEIFILIAVLIAVVVVGLGIAFVTVLIKFKNRVLSHHEEIKKAKSRVRVAQNKYVKALHNTSEALRQNANNPGAGRLVGDMGSASKYGTNAGMVADLAAAYERAQNELNNIISQYNKYIGEFPRSVLAAILKYKPENYIDEENLEQSVMLSGIDQAVI